MSAVLVLKPYTVFRRQSNMGNLSNEPPFYKIKNRRLNDWINRSMDRLNETISSCGKRSECGPRYPFSFWLNEEKHRDQIDFVERDVSKLCLALRIQIWRSMKSTVVPTSKISPCMIRKSYRFRFAAIWASRFFPGASDCAENHQTGTAAFLGKSNWKKFFFISSRVC